MVSRIKTDFEGDVRRFVLRGKGLKELTTLCTLLYEIDEMVVRYKDEEGDYVTISTDREFEDQKAEAANGTLKLVVQRVGAPPPPSSPPKKPTSDPVAAPSEPAAASADSASSTPVTPDSPSATASAPSPAEPPSTDASSSAPSATPATAASSVAPPVSPGTTVPASAPPETTTPSSARSSCAAAAAPSPEPSISAATSDPPVPSAPTPATVEATSTPPASSETAEDGEGSTDNEVGPEQAMKAMSSFFQSLVTPSSREGRSGRGRFGRRSSPSSTDGGQERCRPGLRASYDEVRAAFEDVSPEIRADMKSLYEQLKQSTSIPAFFAAVPAAARALYAFMQSGLGDSGLPPAEDADSVTAAITEAFTPHIGEENSSHITAFVRRALSDDSVLVLLRELHTAVSGFLPALQSSVSGIAGAAERAMTRMGHMGRFDVHAGVSCDECETVPIVGTRHCCTTRPNYDLCGTCFADESVDKGGLNFRPVHFPWEMSAGTRKVPRSTLAFGANGGNVAWLQKLLTDQGLMTADMYRFRTGHFGKNTAAAVNGFRDRHGLGRSGRYGVYDNAVESCLLALLDSDVPPTSTSEGRAGSKDNAVSSAA